MIQRFLQDFGWHKINTQKSPHNVGAIKSITAQNDNDREAVSHRDARGVTGRLLWVAATRPDIAWATANLARHAHDPGANWWTAAKRIAAYLKGTAEAALVYEPSDDNSVVLSAYVDADHAGCPITSRSTTGAIYKVNGTAVHWTSKRQTTAMKSSTDAEMFGAAAATTEIMWLQDILQSLGSPQNNTELHSDNNGVVINSNTATNRRSKHMNVKFAVVRDAKYQRKIKIIKCQSAENVANGLTKPVGPSGIAKLNRAVNLRSSTK